MKEDVSKRLFVKNFHLLFLEEENVEEEDDWSEYAEVL